MASNVKKCYIRLQGGRRTALVARKSRVTVELIMRRALAWRSRPLRAVAASAERLQDVAGIHHHRDTETQGKPKAKNPESTELTENAQKKPSEGRPVRDSTARAAPTATGYRRKPA